MDTLSFHKFYYVPFNIDQLYKDWGCTKTKYLAVGYMYYDHADNYLLSLLSVVPIVCFLIIFISSPAQLSINYMPNICCHPQISIITLVLFTYIVLINNHNNAVIQHTMISLYHIHFLASYPRINWSFR